MQRNSSAVHKPRGAAMSGDALLTVREVAQRLRMSATFVYDNKHSIGCILIGRAIRFRASTVEAYLLRQSGGAGEG